MTVSLFPVYGHPRVRFQVQTGSALALRYNDRSVLESMHVAEAFQVLGRIELVKWCTPVLGRKLIQISTQCIFVEVLFL